MPTFGDYETVGETLAAINLQSHVSTVWKARKGGERDKREFVVKNYAPHRKSREGSHEDALDRDRGLEFLEGIKQLKKAHSKNARYLSPVHDFGISAEGAWYVTDFYPRGSLLTLIGRRAKVDSAALKQIIRCIVGGCLALKNARGISHGNLKASNVFLVGKPRSLPKTPLVLADPYPASPLQLARLDADDRQSVGELLQQVMEAQDLQALGIIILQLVERREVRSGYDYNYPIARSEAWDNLGKDGERWRELCNQLLDPQLSLDKVNLVKLEKKFRSNPIMPNMPVILAGAGLIGLVAGTLFFVRPIIIRQPQQDTTSEVGSSANFTVSAWGFKLRYQWWKDGNVIIGATNSNFEIVSDQTNNSGRYYVVINNRAGARTSAVARLTVTVTPARLTVTAGDTNRIYGTNNPPLTGEISPLRPGDHITATYRTLAGMNSPVGNYDIVPILNDPDNKLHFYTVITNRGTLTITPARLTVTADDTNRVYGKDNPPLTGEIAGLRLGDGITATYRTTASINSREGGYDILPVLNDPDNKLHNYTVIANKGTLTVRPATNTTLPVLTITTENKSRVYGEDNPPLNGKISSLHPADHITATYSTAASINSPVGGYEIVPMLKDPDNKLHFYTVITNKGTLTVTPATLKVTADDAYRIYGTNNPPLTGAISGLRPGDDITATYRTLAGMNSPVGNYDIVPVLNDLENKSHNYIVITNKGTLTVKPANLIVTADDKSRFVGENNPPLTGNISGLRLGDDIKATYSTAASISSPPGKYDIVPMLNDPHSKLRNYNVIAKNGSLTVNSNNPPVPPTRPPLINKFGISGFDFVWIAELRGGKGAYVEKTELSQEQYSNFAGQYGLTPSKKQILGTTLDDPINLSYEDAGRLRDALNNVARQSKLPGQFQLPSPQDFLVFSEVNDFTGNSNPQYNPKYASLTNLFLRLQAANVSGGQPRGVGAGTTNKFGLYNVLGNSWEWCDDQSGAGFGYDSISGSLFKAKYVKGLYTGVRFLFVPNQ